MGLTNSVADNKEQKEESKDTIKETIKKSYSNNIDDYISKYGQPSLTVDSNGSFFSDSYEEDCWLMGGNRHDKTRISWKQEGKFNSYLVIYKDIKGNIKIFTRKEYLILSNDSSQDNSENFFIKTL